MAEEPTSGSHATVCACADAVMRDVFALATNVGFKASEGVESDRWYVDCDLLRTWLLERVQGGEKEPAAAAAATEVPEDVATAIRAAYDAIAAVEGPTPVAE